MPYNGPAIWGGCVTRRKHRVGSWYPASGRAGKLSRCKEGMARVFAVRVQVLSKLGVSRYNFDRSQKTITVQNFYKWHWCGVAVQG